MGTSSSAHRRLARAHLALAGEPEPAPAQRSLPRALAALAATVVLALAGPLAWAAAVAGSPPSDQPAATVATGGPSPEADDEPEDGDA